MFGPNLTLSFSYKNNFRKVSRVRDGLISVKIAFLNPSKKWAAQINKINNQNNYFNFFVFTITLSVDLFFFLDHL